jgi:hypothetical protein
MPTYVSSSQCISAGQASSSECTGVDFGANTFNQIYPPLWQVADGKKDAERVYRSTELLRTVSDSGRSEAFFSIKETARQALKFDVSFLYAFNTAMSYKTESNTDFNGCSWVSPS